MTFVIIWQIKYHDKGFKNENICIYIVFDNGKRDTLWNSDHLSSGKNPLGIGHLGDEAQPFKVPTVQLSCYLIKSFSKKNKKRPV